MKPGDRPPESALSSEIISEGFDGEDGRTPQNDNTSPKEAQVK